MEEVLLVIKGKAQSGKRGQIKAAFEEHLAPRAEANDAQSLVVWAEDQSDGDTFFLIEVYRNKTALDQNSQAPWFSEYMQATGPLLDGQPEFSMATPVWSKGL